MLQVTPGARRALLQLVCALLLFAQQIALTHAIWHVSHELPAPEQHVHDRDGGHSQDTEAANLCSFDAAFGQVLGGAPITTYVFLAHAAGGASALDPQRASATQRFLAPLSRGPPSFL